MAFLSNVQYASGSNPHFISGSLLYHEGVACICLKRAPNANLESPPGVSILRCMFKSILRSVWKYGLTGRQRITPWISCRYVIPLCMRPCQCQISPTIECPKLPSSGRVFLLGRLDRSTLNGWWGLLRSAPSSTHQTWSRCGFMIVFFLQFPNQSRILRFEQSPVHGEKQFRQSQWRLLLILSMLIFTTRSNSSKAASSTGCLYFPFRIRGYVLLKKPRRATARSHISQSSLVSENWPGCSVTLSWSKRSVFLYLLLNMSQVHQISLVCCVCWLPDSALKR